MGKRSQSTSTILSEANLALFFLLLLFFWLATLHSLIVPLTQGEDELAHYRYLAFIAEHGRLPATREEREEAWYRSDWPALYHLFVGWLVSPLDTTRPPFKDVGEPPQRRLVGEIFYPRLIIYTEDANWPWQDGILAWHLGRLISILFATIALIFTYLTTQELLQTVQENPKSKIQNLPRTYLVKSKIPFLVTALLAFTPRYLFTSAMLSDDSLFILLSALFIWLLLRALRGYDSWGIYAFMGLLLGLSISTKYSTGLLPMAVIPVVWWRARQVAWRRRQALGRIVLTWLFTLIGSSWWFGWIIYHLNTIERDGWFFGTLSPVLASGPDVSMRRIFSFFSGETFTGSLRPAAVAEGGFGAWWVYLFQTFWGVPVLEYDPLFPWAYLLFFLFCLLALFGLWHYWRQAETETRRALGLLAFIVILLLPFPILRFFLTFNILETGQGRHILYPAAQAIPILLILGWLHWVTYYASRFTDHGPRTTRYASYFTPYVSRITPYALRFTFYFPPLFLLTWSLFQLAYMGLVYPDPLPVRTTTFNPATIPQPLKQDFSEAIQFLGYDFQTEPDQAIVNLTLFWRARETVAENYRVRVRLVDPAKEPQFTWLSHPLNGIYPTRTWDKGDVIRDTLPLPLAGLPANDYTLQLDLLHEAEDTPLNAEPFSFIQIPLRKVEPIAGASTLAGYQYRLWGNEQPVRQRQTLALSWLPEEQALAAAGAGSGAGSEQAPAWVLVGPDGQPRSPATTGAATTMFMVGADWPSGDYRLGLADSSAETEPLVRVNNEPRLFVLPADMANQPGWASVEANFAGQIKLLGYQLASRRLEPGGEVVLRLAWQGIQPVLPDAVNFAVLLDAEQQPFGSLDRYPNDFYSPLLWAEGEVVPDAFSLAIPPEAPPGIYFLHLGLYQVVKGQAQSLPLTENGQPLDQTAVLVGPLKVGGPPAGVTVSSAASQVSLNQALGDQITLLGYDLSLSRDGETERQNLKLTLYWRAETEIEVDYTTFLHLRNGANETVVQKDSPPAAGRYPTSLWDKGEIIVDEMVLPLDEVTPGEYTPVVGLYEFTTGARLPVPGNPANEIKLNAIVLEE
jgi:hypothetical protein